MCVCVCVCCTTQSTAESDQLRRHYRNVCWSLHSKEVWHAK